MLIGILLGCKFLKERHDVDSLIASFGQQCFACQGHRVGAC